MLVTYIATFLKIFYMLLKIKDLRMQKKVSQEELAAKTGLSKRMIIDYEKENTDIQIKKLQLIANALEVSFFDMFNFPMDNFESTKSNDDFEKLNEPKEKYNISKCNIEILEDYNRHLKSEIIDLKSDKDLLKRIIESKLINL